MSKILLLGDTHLGLGYPNKLDHFFKVTSEYFEKFLFPLAEKNLTKDDIIVHLGDMFDNRDIVPINILNYAQYIIERLSRICTVHLLIGNHDIYNKSENDINSLKAYNHIPNVFVYEKPEIINYYDKKILMMPWVESREKQVTTLKTNSGCDYLFCHSDLNGARMHLNSVAHRNNDKINVEEFSGYKNVYSGHIHLVQKNKNFTFVGSIHEMDRNDIDNQKGIFILDTKLNTEEFIPNNISPKFKKIYINKEEDIEKLSQEDISKNWIDLYISNNLLVSNRKLRRKMENILREGKFSSVEYIDDIQTEEEITNINIDTENDLTLNLDHVSYIKNYITSRNYDNNIHNGLNLIFDNIIEIYKETNKKLD